MNPPPPFPMGKITPQDTLAKTDCKNIRDWVWREVLSSSSAAQLISVSGLSGVSHDPDRALSVLTSCPDKWVFPRCTETDLSVLTSCPDKWVDPRGKKTDLSVLTSCPDKCLVPRCKETDLSVLTCCPDK